MADGSVWARRRRLALRAGTLGLLLLVAGCNAYVIWRGRRRFSTAGDVPNNVVMILGASVHRDGSVSTVLRDRLDTALDLFRRGHATKLLITGDPRDRRHNEIAAMKSYLLAHDVPEDAIVVDDAGYDTFSSLYRARHVFALTTLTVVTQRFHLSRALYYGEAFGIDVHGVVADRREYHALFLREWLSRCKAVFDVVRGRVPDA